MDFSKIIDAVKSGDFSPELRQDIENALEYTAEHIQQYGGRQPTDIFNVIRQETTQEQYAVFDRWWSGEKDFCYASHADSDSENEDSMDEDDFRHFCHFCHASSDSEIKFSDFHPLDQSRTELPVFPIGAIPEPIRQYVLSVAEAVQAPVDMVAIAVLSMFATATQGKFEIEVKSGWIEPVNLYCLVVADPSERKSPVLKEVEAPVFKWQAQENERRRPEIIESAAKVKLLRQQLDSLQKAAASPTRKNEISIEDVVNKAKELDAVREVRELQLVFDDVTPEALARAMQANDERAAIISAEGGLFGTLAGRYSDVPNIDLFLKSYSGEFYNTTRITREGESMEHPLLTIGILGQPQIISEIMQNTTLKGRGLFARFLYSLPVSRTGERVFDTVAVDSSARATYEERLFELFKAADMGSARTLYLSEAGKIQIRAWFNEVERRLVSDLAPIKEWAGKLVGNTMRIAALYHIMTWGMDSFNHELSPETIASAIQTARYFIEHARAAFDLADYSETQEMADAKYIISRVIQHDKNDKNGENRELQFVTLRELIRLCQRLKTKEDLLPGLAILEENGYVRTITEKTKGKGRPTKKIFLNPAWLATLQGGDHSC